MFEGFDAGHFFCKVGRVKFLQGRVKVQGSLESLSRMGSPP